MLHRVSEYVERYQVPYRVGCAFLDARFVIACDNDGNYLGLDEHDKKKRREFPCAPFLEQPDMISGGITKAQFLLDTASAVAHYSEKDAQPGEEQITEEGGKGKAEERHRYFWKLIAEAAETVEDLKPLAKLNSPGTLQRIRQELKEKKAKTTDPVTFRIGLDYPIERDYWHSWWDKKLAGIRALKTGNDASGKSIVPMLSLLSGNPVAPCRTHPKLKRLPDSQPSGASLISFEKSSPAFRSFQLEQSQNCAMSEVEATTYAAGLNHLIRKQSRDLAGAKVLYWYKEPVLPSDDVVAVICPDEDDRPKAQDDLSEDPSAVPGALQRMRDLLDAIHTGQRPDLAGNEFYVLTMAGNRGRAVVRDWQEGSYKKLLEAVLAWQEDTAILLPSGKLPSKVPGMRRLIECVLPPLKKGQKREEWHKRAQHIRSSLWRAAIGNRELPYEVVYRLVPELRDFALTGALESCFPIRRDGKQKGRKKEKDQASNNNWLLWQRMALLKAYHLRKGTGSNFASGQERNNHMAIQQCLNPDHPSPAYHCGRLMAVLANVQREALGDIGAGVIQRYYAAACATPGLVFGRLIRNTQYHIDKIRSKKDWLARFFNQSLAEICCHIGQEIPKTLSLEEQSLFALGFYQQMAKPWKDVSEKATNDNGSGPNSAQTNSEENAQ